MLNKVTDDAVHNDKDRFTATRLAALRSDLLQSDMIDSYEAAELLQVFLMGRGYGFCPRQRWMQRAGLFAKFGFCGIVYIPLLYRWLGGYGSL